MHVGVETTGEQGEIAMLLRHAQSITERFDGSESARFVTVMTRPFFARCECFAEIVGEQCETHDAGRVARSGDVERQQQMFAGVDFGMPFGALWHAEERSDFGQHDAQRSTGAQRFECRTRRGLVERAFEFAPHAFGDQRIDFARGHHRLHEHHRFRCDAKTERREPCRKTRHAQDAHRILDEGRRHVSQHACLEIGAAAVRVDQGAVGALRHRVDGEVASREILLERHARCEVGGEAAIAGCDLALETREGVFFVGLGVQENRKIAPDCAKAARLEILRRCADDDPVTFFDRASEQLVAYRAAD